MVILYSADPLPSFRVAAIMKYIGVKDVRVLNGGYAKWTNAKFEVQTTANNKQPVSSFGTLVPTNRYYIMDMTDARKILADKNGSVLVDIRSWFEYIGQISGYDYIKFKGRPKGAIWGHDLSDFRNIDNTMRNMDEILAMWKEWEITPEKNMVFFCGTGWRASEVLFYA